MDLVNNVLCGNKYSFSIYVPGYEIYKDKDGLALKKHTVWRGRCTITHTCTHMIKILETNIEQWIS